MRSKLLNLSHILMRKKFLKPTIFLVFFLIFPVIFYSCSSDTSSQKRRAIWSQSDGRLKILSTTAMINDLVEEIANGFVETNTLIEGGLDPHSYELVKGDDEKVQLADVIFFNGLGLEHGPSLNKYLKESGKAVGLGDELIKTMPDSIIEDRDQTDPHIWMDVSLWAANINTIVDVLSLKDPLHKDDYKKRGLQLYDKMMQSHNEIVLLFQKIPSEKRYLVTSHDAFNYFAKAYLRDSNEIDYNQWKKRFNAPEGLAPEGQISVKDIQNIIEHMKKYNISVIFPESNVSRDSIKKIVDAGRKEGLNFCIAKTTLYGDAMGNPGTLEGTYLGMMESNAKTIAGYFNQNEKCSSK